MAADMLTWGALEKCEKCQGQFQLGKNNYICKGQLTEWSKCMTTLVEPPRKKVKIPKDKCFEFLKEKKLTVSHRIFNAAPKTTEIKVEVKTEEQSG